MTDFLEEPAVYPEESREFTRGCSMEDLLTKALSDKVHAAHF
jgi:hypothetical protein